MRVRITSFSPYSDFSKNVKHPEGSILLKVSKIYKSDLIKLIIIDLRKKILTIK